MKNSVVLILFLFPLQVVSQPGDHERDTDAPRSADWSLLKPAGTLDRATGIHDKGNIRHTFENRGKLYPRRKADGPDGEFPPNSGHEHIYRLNPFVGIPRNVIQGRYTSNEEWEAVGGYHNPVQTGHPLLSVAMSDKPYTWPVGGWPIRDSLGNPVVLSEQDSYCVYSDSSSKTPIGLLVKQTAYCWGVKPASNIIFFKFEVVNASGRPLDSMYFCMYNELHIGNVSGGDPEYADDRFGFEPGLGLVYKYDADRRSNEWSMNPLNNEFGVMLIQTPTVNGVERGVTDWHYLRIDDDNNLDIDSLLFGVMSSDPAVYNNPFWGPRLFHLGANAPDLHYDDPNTVPTTGSDGTSYLSSGPYTVLPGASLTFIAAIVAGSDHAELMDYARRAVDIVRGGFAVASAPPPPHLYAVSGDRQVFLSWDNSAEQVRDKFSQEFDFEGYRFYRSSDNGISWTRFAEYDKLNDIGANTGLQYTYTDSAVTNGFEYWYSITAYDRGDSLIPSLESPVGSNADLPNVRVARPREATIGFIPATLTQWVHTGASNYAVEVFARNPQVKDSRQYAIRFAPAVSVERGNPASAVEVTIVSPAVAPFEEYAIVFDSVSTGQGFRVIETATDSTILSQQYVSGQAFTFNGISVTITDPDTNAVANLKPQAGDSILIGPGVLITADTDTVLPLHRLSYAVPVAASNGISLRITAPPSIRTAQLVSGQGLLVQATVQYPDSIVDDTYRISVVANNNDSLKTINIRATNAAGSIVASKDSLRSGSTGITLRFGGLSVKVSYATGTIPDITTVYQIVTEKRRPLTYLDQYTFSIAGWQTNADAARNELSRIKVVPNPYIVSSLYETEFGALRREPLRMIRFTHLPPECTIYIYTLDGDLLQTINHNDQTGDATWDLRTAGKREIVTGVYFYLVKTPYGERLDRFAVVK